MPKVCFSRQWKSVQIQNTKLYYSVQYLQVGKYTALIKRSNAHASSRWKEFNSMNARRKIKFLVLAARKLLLTLLCINNLNKVTPHVPILSSRSHPTLKPNPQAEYLQAYPQFHSLTTTNQQTGAYPNQLLLSIIFYQRNTAEWKIGAVKISTDCRGSIEETDWFVPWPIVPSYFFSSSASLTLGKTSSIAIATDRGYTNHKSSCQRLARMPISKLLTNQVGKNVFFQCKRQHFMKVRYQILTSR